MVLATSRQKQSSGHTIWRKTIQHFCASASGSQSSAMLHVLKLQKRGPVFKISLKRINMF